MTHLSLATLDSYAAQHPAVRDSREISVWAWIAGAVLLMIALAAVLAPSPREGLSVHPLLPVIGPAVPDIADPVL